MQLSVTCHRTNHSESRRKKWNRGARIRAWDVAMSEASGSALVDRSIRRRWLTSAAIVVLLHAGLAIGVLTWRSMRAAPPIEINLTPPPPASGQNVAQAPSPTAQQGGANPDVAAAGKGAGLNEAESGMTASQVPSSPEGDAAASGAGSGTASADASPEINPPITPPTTLGGSTLSSPMAGMPLDTSITVQPPLRRNGAIGPLASREAGQLGHLPMSQFRPATPFGVPDIPRNGAHGAHVQDRARAAISRSMRSVEVPKTSIGSSATAIASRGDVTGLNAGISRNALGITSNFRPRIPRAGAGDYRIGITTIASRAVPMAPVINGRGFARSAIGPAMIGGPARASGILSGNDFHLRH
jgi:hypothetical protein